MRVYQVEVEEKKSTRNWEDYEDDDPVDFIKKYAHKNFTFGDADDCDGVECFMFGIKKDGLESYYMLFMEWEWTNGGSISFNYKVRELPKKPDIIPSGRDWIDL